MSSYEGLAASYDALTTDVGYEKRADFLEKLFRRSRIPVHTVLDLACGTGTMTWLLTDRGYELIGVDGSEEMLAAAMEKSGQVEGGIMAAGNVSAILEKNPDPEAMLRTVLSDFEVKVLEQEPVEYRCGCSRDRIERALLSLGRDELSAILAEQGSCDLTCQFCDRVYHFSGPELEGLIQSLEKKD